jgi:hypothetical protein
MAEMFEITDFKPKIKNQVIKIKQQDLRLQCPFKLTVSGKRFTFYIMHEGALKALMPMPGRWPGIDVSALRRQAFMTGLRAWHQCLPQHCSHSSHSWHDLIFNLRTFL